MILLRLITWPYVRKHLLRSVLTTAGIVLGVALLVGMQTANRSVLQRLQPDRGPHRRQGAATGLGRRCGLQRRGAGARPVRCPKCAPPRPSSKPRSIPASTARASCSSSPSI